MPMKAPNIIFVPMVNLGIEDGEHPAPLWWNKDKKSQHSDVVGTIEYIRKEVVEHIIRSALGPQDALNKLNSL